MPIRVIGRGMPPLAGAACAGLAAAALAGLLPVLALGSGNLTSAFDAYTLSVFKFTIWQAFLSALLSVVIGVPVAIALARQSFWGRKAFVRLLSLPQALPAIVAVLGIVEIYGEQGWLGGIFKLYGLTGILLAHVFFNFPLVARLCLGALEAIPSESHRLAAQLGFSNADVTRHLFRPALMAVLPAASILVFMLCAASFTIVLILGGGPQASTMEVAIYQALRADFDPARAAILAIIQLALTICLIAISQRFIAKFTTAPQLRLTSATMQSSRLTRATDFAIIICAALILLPPIFAIVLSGLRGFALSSELLGALITSLAMAAATATLTIIISWALADWAARSIVGQKTSSIANVMALLLPPAIIATGWFILFNQVSWFENLTLLLIVILNSLVALPFCFNVISPAAARHAASTDRLCETLGLRGFDRLRHVDFPSLRRPLARAAVMAAIVALGDLTAILLLGTGKIVTLPALLYQQMGTYRLSHASGTALVLTITALALLTIFDKLATAHD